MSCKKLLPPLTFCNCFKGDGLVNCKISTPLTIVRHKDMNQRCHQRILSLESTDEEYLRDNLAVEFVRSYKLYFALIVSPI